MKSAVHPVNLILLADFTSGEHHPLHNTNTSPYASVPPPRDLKMPGGNYGTQIVLGLLVCVTPPHTLGSLEQWRKRRGKRGKVTCRLQSVSRPPSARGKPPRLRLCLRGGGWRQGATRFTPGAAGREAPRAGTPRRVGLPGGNAEEATMSRAAAGPLPRSGPRLHGAPRPAPPRAGPEPRDLQGAARSDPRSPQAPRPPALGDPPPARPPAKRVLGAGVGPGRRPPPRAPCLCVQSKCGRRTYLGAHKDARLPPGSLRAPTAAPSGPTAPRRPEAARGRLRRQRPDPQASPAQSGCRSPRPRASELSGGAGRGGAGKATPPMRPAPGSPAPAFLPPLARVGRRSRKAGHPHREGRQQGLQRLASGTRWERGLEGKRGGPGRPGNYFCSPEMAWLHSLRKASENQNRDLGRDHSSSRLELKVLF
ncbi:hypothetical protein H8959_011350 [Pygathrix nigripes]